MFKPSQYNTIANNQAEHRLDCGFVLSIGRGKMLS
jgi:hypothetical protein